MMNSPVTNARTAVLRCGMRCAGLALGLLAAVGGCSLAPPHAAPDLPVAARYPDDIPVSAGSVAADITWRDYFADPGLQGLIARALENSRDLRSAVLRVEEARAAYGIRRADQFPTIGLGFDGSRSRTPADLSVTGEVLNGGQYQVGASLASWELDFWGRVRNLKEAALEEFLATDAARRALTVSLVAQVADAYLALRELDERIVLARRTIESRQESFRIFTRRFEVGATSRLDLTQVETLLTQAQTLGVQLEQARSLQAHALAVLVGAPLDLQPATAFRDDLILYELGAGLPSDLLTQRPDIVAAEHRLKAANASIAAARAAFFPRVALTASAGTASAALEGLFEPGSGAWRFAPSLSLPIFDGGRNRAALDLAEVRRDLAVAAYEKTVQTAFREVADALAARHWLTEQLGIQRAALAAQSERARLAKLRYDNGAARYLEVLDAQRDLLAAEQQLVQTRRALMSSRIGLYAALGGGSRHLADPPAASRTTGASVD
ncbi:AdeC/AdeK/OprM family multidrug efflux complex outer membrane factor [Azoarcus sp. DD4]|uniref:AdeC/AdeK/OprM family multidrug efflux complex outer membrane factor n=1 Tax=Azoarcus sp. DD4 TaxID=2027405 RepID=UPI001F10381B|nr:AdeC/AdeK/OprM family multidrug efflux complex outer membrane factor [Azoarcus sp. DD4]